MGGSESKSGPLNLDAPLQNLWKLVTDIFVDMGEDYPAGELMKKYLGQLDDISATVNQLTPDMQAVVDKIFPYMEDAQSWLKNTIGTLGDLYDETKTSFDALNQKLEEPIQYNRNILGEATDYWLNAEKEYQGIKNQMPQMNFMGATGSGGSNVSMQAFPSNAANRLNTQFNTAAGIGQNAVNSMGSLMGQQGTNLATSLGLRSNIAGTMIPGVAGQYQTGAENMATLMGSPINLAAQLAPLQAQLATTQYQTPLNWMDFVKQLQLGRYGTAVQSQTTDPNWGSLMPSLALSFVNPFAGAASAAAVGGTNII